MIDPRAKMFLQLPELCRQASTIRDQYTKTPVVLYAWPGLNLPTDLFGSDFFSRVVGVLVTGGKGWVDLQSARFEQVTAQGTARSHLSSRLLCSDMDAIYSVRDFIRRFAQFVPGDFAKSSGLQEPLEDDAKGLVFLFSIVLMKLPELIVKRPDCMVVKDLLPALVRALEVFIEYIRSRGSDPVQWAFSATPPAIATDPQALRDLADQEALQNLKALQGRDDPQAKTDRQSLASRHHEQVQSIEAWADMLGKPRPVSRLLTQSGHQAKMAGQPPEPALDKPANANTKAGDVASPTAGDGPVSQPDSGGVSGDSLAGGGQNIQHPPGVSADSLAGGGQNIQHPPGVSGQSTRITKKIHQTEWLARAMLLVQEYPDWSDAAVAKASGVSPSTLSRSKAYQAAARMARQREVPKGWKTDEGDLGAIEDGDGGD